MGFADGLRKQAGNSFLAEDLNLFLPRIEICGDRKVTLENHSGILEYGSDVMRIRCGKLIVKISGEDLELKFATLTDLVVSGKIISVELL